MFILLHLYLLVNSATNTLSNPGDNSSLAHARNEAPSVAQQNNSIDEPPLWKALAIPVAGVLMVVALVILCIKRESRSSEDRTNKKLALIMKHEGEKRCKEKMQAGGTCAEWHKFQTVPIVEEPCLPCSPCCHTSHPLKMKSNEMLYVEKDEDGNLQNQDSYSSSGDSKSTLSSAVGAASISSNFSNLLHAAPRYGDTGNVGGTTMRPKHKSRNKSQIIVNVTGKDHQTIQKRKSEQAALKYRNTCHIHTPPGVQIFFDKLGLKAEFDPRYNKMWQRLAAQGALDDAQSSDSSIHKESNTQTTRQGVTKKSKTNDASESDNLPEMMSFTDGNDLAQSRIKNVNKKEFRSSERPAKKLKSFNNISKAAKQSAKNS